MSNVRRSQPGSEPAVDGDDGDGAQDDADGVGAPAAGVGEGRHPLGAARVISFDTVMMSNGLLILTWTQYGGANCDDVDRIVTNRKVN